MKFLSIISIIVVALAPLVCAGHSKEDSSSLSESEEKPSYQEVVPKVKIIKAELLSLSDEYYAKPFEYEVVIVNKTHSRLAADYEIIKNFPEDTYLTFEVLRSNLKSDNYEKIQYYTVAFCTNKKDKYDAYLPDILLEAKNSGKCLPKGHYSQADVGFFKFYDLLAKEDLKGAKFILITNLVSGHEILYSIKLEIVSNLY